MFRESPTKLLDAELATEPLVEPRIWSAPEPIALTAETDSRSRVFARFRGHEWITALLFMACDVVSWILLYAVVGFTRRDVFFANAFEFVLVDCLLLVVILQALYIVGGYDRNTDMRSLTYTTEHILAVIGAAALGSLVLYSAAAFDAAMKPSRGVLLVSFIVFLPVSLSYRRFLWRRIAASTAQRTFLVVGGGELAKRFYQAYKDSPNHQRLEFVTNNQESIGSTIAGEGSPIIEGDIVAKLAQLDQRYSGVILAEGIDRLDERLIERLVRTQFQKTRVYTLESFYEAQWRHVPLHTIDPVWPLQMGFQLTRVSPYHYLKRLCDIALSAALLLIFLPVFPVIILSIWLESGRPAFFRQTRVGREGQRFVAYKFRTMSSGAEASDDIYTREGDS